MEKSAVTKAYDAYLLMQEAQKSKQYHHIDEEEILGVLRILQSSYRKDGFSSEEIEFVVEQVYTEYGRQYLDKRIASVLLRAQGDGKVFRGNRGWKLVPIKE